MSKKKDRAWFVCRQWPSLVAKYFTSDAEVGRTLKIAPQVLARLRAGTPVAKSTLLRILQAFASRYDPGAPIADLIIDTRSQSR
jgi:hypothetical protein